jgi:hypothetical protein
VCVCLCVTSTSISRSSLCLAIKFAVTIEALRSCFVRWNVRLNYAILTIFSFALCPFVWLILESDGNKFGDVETLLWIFVAICLTKSNKVADCVGRESKEQRSAGECEVV